MEVLISNYQERKNTTECFLKKVGENFIIPTDKKEGLLLLRNVDGAKETEMYPKVNSDLWFYFRYNKTKERYDIHLYDKKKGEKDKDTFAFAYSSGIPMNFAEAKKESKKSLSFKDYINSRLNLMKTTPLKEHNEIFLPYKNQASDLIKKQYSQEEREKFQKKLEELIEPLDYLEKIFMNQVAELLMATLSK